ncbi:hypothetical protein OSB04_010335 [Centaurea solstitialis]|uniref:Uncharacterized protein n=1 Tax=Centaurea solstitialis TaxID=347529 RepID=A0AA38TKJ5_9ASTR|nr:hypothetical protein OSB04_010335 [Centaurea solstitialis]
MVSQVWIRDHVASSSSSQDARLWLKLTGHVGRTFLEDGDFDSLDGYETAYDRLPMKLDNTIVGKTLESYQPNTYTGDLDYVFQFYWDHHQARDNSVLVDHLLLTLKVCLPSFKLASAIDFGEQMDILYVINSPRNRKQIHKDVPRKQTIIEKRETING